MKSFFKKSIPVLLGLLVAIAIIGHLLPREDSAVTVPVVAEKVLVPGGQSVGVRMDVKGVLVVGLEEIECEDGQKVNPGVLGGLQIGDSIVQVNGSKVTRADQVQSLVNEICDTVKLRVKRNSRLLDVKVTPVKSDEDGLYKLGVWVKGKDGEPGEIKGLFYHVDQPLGNLKKNSSFGVFGSSYHPIENPLYSKTMAIGTREQVETGKAYILSTLGSNEVRKFEIEIVKVEKQRKPADKSMVIKVTDKDLLQESGGIVQGMSGSPIIQNDRIIGAVTHVFVNDPAQGYGIFIEWMLNETDFVEN